MLKHSPYVNEIFRRVLTFTNGPCSHQFQIPSCARLTSVILLLALSALHLVTLFVI